MSTAMNGGGPTRPVGPKVRLIGFRRRLLIAFGTFVILVAIGVLTMAVGPNGNPPTAGKAVPRYIGYLISDAVLSLGFLWISLDKKRQGWHDKIAGTYVVDVDDGFDDAAQVTFVEKDKDHGWVWWLIWLVFALFLSGALLAGLWVLSPLIPKAFNALLGG